MKHRIVSRLAILLCVFCLFGAVAVCQAEQGNYVLMNIPYAAFYEAEVTDASGIDAVSSSTLMKSRTATLAGGSYHVDPVGTDITGVIFPVYVEDKNVLATLGGVEITDESQVEITVTNKGQESTNVFAGSEALFEAPSFSWYALAETPAAYKALNADGSFGAIQAETTALNGSASFVYDRHADMVMKVAGADDALADLNVSGVILTADDGTKVGLRHIANLWRKTQIGFDLDSDVYNALKGKRIAQIEFITWNGLFTIDVDVAVSDDELLPRLNGTYIDLFPEFAKEEYKDYWMECLAAYGIEGEAAEGYYVAMTQGFMGTLKGQEAIDAFGSDPASMIFDCYLENGLKSVTIDGDVIYGVDADGKEAFRHAYHYLDSVDVTFFGQPTGTQLRVYATDDADAGMFTYFAFADDTIAETQHVEFRYGASLENMGSYDQGEYAYWLVGAINDNYKESQIKDCIKLFVDENAGEEEEAEAAAVVEIATAEDLAAINSNLSGSYVLTADIDLGGKEWTPIGSFVQLGQEGEEAEMPDLSYAFTGTFDGQGHTISNLVIEQPDKWTLGLFGCVANAQIGNFTVNNATVEGTTMVSAVVGYSFCSTVSNVTLEDSLVVGYASEISGEGMYGGIVGAGMASLIENCVVRGSSGVVVPANSANGGLVGGGLEMTSVVNCTATGRVQAGDNCYGIGGISGCGFAAEQFTGNTADHVQLAVGDNCFWIGGITGYAGGYEDASIGLPVTAFTGCKASQVDITAGENVDGVGAIVGAGFFYEGLAEAYGNDVWANPTVFTLTNCESANVTLNDKPLE
ncbi:MAG: hypothetical protein IJ662_13850 [Clostridia bacterium]|nr:hypothetical protein [Clostridia bacterium]MBR1586620.1 hypothetical protein [Clostridia bacterium]